MREILSAGLIKNIPRSFIYTFKNQSHFTGPYAQIIANFAAYNNMILRFHSLGENTSTKEAYEYLIHRRYDILTFSNVYSQRDVDGIEHSYPVEWMKKCIMVPLEDELPKYFYIIWPYGRYIWTCIAIGTVYIAILMRFIDTRQGYVPQRSIIRNIPHAWNLTFFTLNMQVNVQDPPKRMMFFYMILFLYGFIITAYHQPYMTAYNMKPIFVQPINTIQEIIDAGHQIVVTRNDFIELSQKDLIGIKDILVNVTITKYETLLRNFSRHHAYVVSEDQWQFIKRQQQQLIKPYFHLTPLCFKAALRSFPIAENWKYATALNLFVLRVQEAGLWTQWIEYAFLRAVAAEHARILLDTYPVEPLNIEFFTIAWSVLAMGLSCSFLVSLIEKILWKLQSRRILVNVS